MPLLSQEELSSMLSPLEGSVCGENCEYDDLYLSLDSLALGSPSNEMGDSIVEGKDPDYRTLYKNCLTLWGKTRDLRVASFFTLASLCLNGLEGLKQGLTIIDYLVNEQFSDFYPQLDPDDDNDPTERINILSMLSPENGAFSDQYLFFTRFREIKLVPELDYTYRDYLIGSGFLEGKDSNVDLNVLNAQMSSIPLTSVQQQLALVASIIDLIDDICTKFNEKISDLGYLTLDSLKHELSVLKNFYSSFAKGVASQVTSDEEKSVTETLNAETINTAAPVQSAKVVQVFNLESFTPKSRNEALLLLKKSADYFNEAEPTSPVPFLINRALRMANMNFIDLLAEIDQNALERGREQLGVLPSNEDNNGF